MFTDFANHHRDIVFSPRVQRGRNQGSGGGGDIGSIIEDGGHDVRGHAFVQSVSGQNQQVFVSQLQALCFRLQNPSFDALIHNKPGVMGGDLLRGDFTLFHEKSGQGLILGHLNQLPITQNIYAAVARVHPPGDSVARQDAYERGPHPLQIGILFAFVRNGKIGLDGQSGELLFPVLGRPPYAGQLIFS